MKFSTDQIVQRIRKELSEYRRELEVIETGRVVEVGDGIARVRGLTHVMAGEMLAFEGGRMGQVFNLEDETIGAVLYSDCEDVKEGHAVRGTGGLLSVPVGDEMLGRVITPLGVAIDGGDEIRAVTRRPTERIAPGIAERQPVNVPLQTGIRAIDAMTPIGRGQRELIIGDRKTGKTAIAIDTIINQRDTGVICVYVAIGQKESTVAGVADILRSHGALAHTVVVSACSSDPASLQYIAPYAGCTIAEHFMYTHGSDTLVVYDDLTKHAKAYREISLLLKRPPGREAYPGDVFYLHSRLLERACRLADRHAIVPKDGAAPPEGADGRIYEGPLGRPAAESALSAMPNPDELVVARVPGSGGSMTALPICETQEGEISAYIPTNLIGITDGQLYLEPGLFFAGIRPAVNVGISVSRVGYKAAVKAMKDVAASLRLDLASYRELESFAQLGMELDADAQARLDHGQRMVRLLAQPQYRPQPVMDQVLTIFAGTSGLLDELPVDEVGPFAEGLLEHIKREHASFYESIVADRELPAQRQRRLKFIIGEHRDTVYLPGPQRPKVGAVEQRARAAEE